MLRAVSLAIVVVCAHAYSYFGGLIPNGRNVTGCDGIAVLGVGHIRTSGGGPRNPFGLDWAAAGFTWTAELCNKDSDGDGMTNGQELGDPNCIWTPESTPSIVEGITHPGQNCQPVPPTPAPTPPPTLAPTPAPTCEVAESNRMECGFYGIDEPGCLNNGCCWRSSGMQGVPWCYAKAAPPVTQCQVPENEKQDCGYSGITQDGCEGVNSCCWEESQQSGVPWCFYGVQTSRSFLFNSGRSPLFVQPRKASRHGFLKLE